MMGIFEKRPVDRRTALTTLAWAGAGLLVGSVGRANGSKTHDEPEPGDEKLAGILQEFSRESRRKIWARLSAPGFSGLIPAEMVRELAAAEHKTSDAVMLGLLPLARVFSRPPISDFYVGAVARGASGSLYLGFNIEIPGQMLGFAVHGEQAALSGAYMHGEENVAAIGIAGGAPCGHCRQFMNEFSPDGEMDVVIQGVPPMKLAGLLPMPFGPKALGRKEGAVPVRETKLVAAVPSSDAVATAAFEAARRSYAPYSGAHSGVAIETRSRRIYRGSYIENVAFNPSLSPLQTALVQMIIAGEEYGAIARVALAEGSGEKISQRNATEAVMSAVAPGVRVEMVLVS